MSSYRGYASNWLANLSKCSISPPSGSVSPPSVSSFLSSDGGAASIDAAFNLEDYTTEVSVPEESPANGITVKALEELGENEIEVITLLRSRKRRYEPAGNVVIKAGDILILQGEPAAHGFAGCATNRRHDRRSSRRRCRARTGVARS